MRRLLFFAAALSLFVAPTVTGGSQLRPQLLGIVKADALFDDTVLHEVRLAVNTTDWQTLKEHYLENTYYPADFRWRDRVVRNVGIRSRGTGSRSGTKPHLLLNFERYTAGQTFLGLESVVLRNNTQDPSNMHERLSMLLFARMGLPASRESYAKLYVNEEYVGLYTIVEGVDEAFLRRTFRDDRGYLFNFEYMGDAQRYYFDYLGSGPAAYVPLPFKPETHEDDPQPEVVQQLVEAVNLTNDAAFRTAVAPYVDLSSFIRHVATEAFLGDDDGLLGNWGMNNFYIYRPPDSTLFTFIGWDKSDAFLNGFSRSIWTNIVGVPDAQRNRLMARALAQPDLFALYLNTVLECARSAGEIDPMAPGGGWLEREIQREYLQIRDAALADPVKPYSNAQFEAAVNDVSVFARHRGNFVNQEVAQARAASRFWTHRPGSSR